MNKNELLAGTAADNCNTAESGSSASLEQNGLLCAVFTGKYDKNGTKIFVGAKIKRLYQYEVKLRDNIPYAHILDGSNYHLKIDEVGRDFEVIFSKAEAIKLMKQGKKLRHRFFSNDEWVTMVGNIVRMEQGQECWASEFWQDRTHKAWETDWFLYGA